MAFLPPMLLLSSATVTSRLSLPLRWFCWWIFSSSLHRCPSYWKLWKVIGLRSPWFCPLLGEILPSYQVHWQMPMRPSYLVSFLPKGPSKRSSQRTTSSNGTTGLVDSARTTISDLGVTVWLGNLSGCSGFNKSCQDASRCFCTWFWLQPRLDEGNGLLGGVERLRQRTAMASAMPSGQDHVSAYAFPLSVT